MRSNDKKRAERERLRELQRRYRARQPPKTPRMLACAIAVAVNASLIVVLSGTASGSRGFRQEAPQERIEVFLLPSIEPLVAPPHLRWSPRVVRLHIATPSVPALLDVPASRGPPTETVAAVSDEPDRQAVVVDTREVQERCRRAYPNEFTSDEENVTLRIYVMADGRIGQGTVIGSSGDGHLDWVTMKCLQAYAHLDPVKQDLSEVGSWQRLVWSWRTP